MGDASAIGKDEAMRIAGAPRNEERSAQGQARGNATCVHFAQAELATKGMGIGTAGHGQPQSRAAYAKVGTAAAQSKSKKEYNAFNIRQFMLAWFAAAATQVAAASPDGRARLCGSVRGRRFIASDGIFGCGAVGAR